MVWDYKNGTSSGSMVSRNSEAADVVEFFRIPRMGLSKIYHALESGRSMSDLDWEFYLDNGDEEAGVFIPDELIVEEDSWYLSAS